MAILSVDAPERDARSVHTGTSRLSSAAQPQHAASIYDLPPRLNESEICFLCMEKAGTPWCCGGVKVRSGWLMRVSYSTGAPNNTQPGHVYPTERTALRAKKSLCADFGINPDNVTVEPVPAAGSVAA